MIGRFLHFPNCSVFLYFWHEFSSYRFCIKFYKEGSWIPVVIDTEIPVNWNNNPVFGRSKIGTILSLLFSSLLLLSCSFLLIFFLIQASLFFMVELTQVMNSGSLWLKKYALQTSLSYFSSSCFSPFSCILGWNFFLFFSLHVFLFPLVKHLFLSLFILEISLFPTLFFVLMFDDVVQAYAKLHGFVFVSSSPFEIIDFVPTLSLLSLVIFEHTSRPHFPLWNGCLIDSFIVLTGRMK